MTRMTALIYERNVRLLAGKNRHKRTVIGVVLAKVSAKSALSCLHCFHVAYSP